MKAIQYFDGEYLEACRHFSVEDILQFIEGFRQLALGSPTAKMKLISMKIETDLLDHFRRKAALENRPYQSKIKDLMRRYCRGD